MRPFVQGDLKAPPNWFLNCTPGGGFTHIRTEICNSEVINPSHIIYLVGTNEISSPIGKSYEAFMSMLKAGRKLFPGVEVITNYLCIKVAN